MALPAKIFLMTAFMAQNNKCRYRAISPLFALVTSYYRWLKYRCLHRADAGGLRAVVLHVASRRMQVLIMHSLMAIYRCLPMVGDVRGVNQIFCWLACTRSVAVLLADNTPWRSVKRLAHFGEFAVQDAAAGSSMEMPCSN